MVQGERIQGLGKELEGMKRDESLAGKLNEYNVSLKNSKTKPEQEILKSQLL